MFRSQNVKGYLRSTPRAFTRVSLFLLLLAISALGLATISVSSHSARRSFKTAAASNGPEELRASAPREIRGRGRYVAGRGAALAGRAGASLTSPVPLVSSITVDRTDDAPSASACTAAASDCSLRGAVAYANLNPGTTINIPAGTYQLSIAGGNEGFTGNNAVGDLDVTGNNTTIVGAGAGSTIIKQTTNDRVIEVNPNLDASFNFSMTGVTIRDGKENAGIGGGGMVAGSQSSTTQITNCAFIGNSATGAGTAGGGAISLLGGSLTITGSTFDGNSTSGSGGAVSYSAGDPFGRTPSSGTLTVSGSTFTNNSADSKAAGGGALEVFNYNGGQGTYQVSSSSFNNNSAPKGNGGAIIVESGPLNVTTSSLASNQAISGGAIYSSGSLSVAYSRLVGNSTSDPTRGLALFRVGGPALSADDNWWGSNAGPSVNDVRNAGPGNTTSAQSVATWLVLSHSANPSSVCANQSTTLTADIKSRNTGSALTTELNGLPAFPTPAATIFSNAVSGTLSAASTQFVNGVATATYTAGNNTGTGSADASVDSQGPVTATVSIDKNATSQPADEAVCPGSTATFTTTASGNGPFSFVWKKGATALSNGDLGGRVTINSSGNTSTLSISNAQSSDADSYTVVATGACNTDTKTANLTINQSTTTTALSNQTVCEGASASFSTTASGNGPFTFVWKKNGNVLSGGGNVTINSSAITSTLSISNAQAGDSATYTVETTGACNTDAESATLTVNASTTATTPNDETVCQGATTNFSTTAGGTGPFTYQWKLDGSDIAGANGSSVSVATGSVGVGSHTVSVVVGGACGSVTRSASLTVQENTSATTPNDQTVCQGASASFSTTASGTGPFTYQWKLDGSDIAGANGSSVSVPTSSLSTGNHTVEVYVGGTCGSVSRSATLTVNENTSATTPGDETVCQGASASFSTTASGTGPFTYQWKLDGNNIAGANGSSVSVATGSLSTGSHAITVVVGGTCGSVTKSASLTVQANTSATAPADETVCQGASASFSTTASGTGPFTYQWKLDGSDIAGANGSSVNIPTGSLSTGSHAITVVVGGTCGTVTQSATLTVNENTSATPLADETVCQGASASFSTTASGTNVTYQWKLDGGNIAGANGSSVNIPTGSLSTGNHSVEVVVSGACGTVTRTATLTVNENTSATTPGDETVCQGATASFSTTASGTNVTYQWKLDGSDIAGANGSSVSIPTSSVSVGNHTVEVVVGGACGSVTRGATLTVNVGPSVTSNPQDLTVVSGNATFTASASGSPTPAVQWQISTDGGANFANIPGATSTTLTFAVNTSMNGYKYRAVFANSCGTVTTTAATLTTCTPASVTSNPQSVAEACVGALVTFTASGGGFPAPTVQWQVSTNGGASFANIPGATSNTLTVTASVAMRNNQYRAVFTNACGTATTSAATLGVDTTAPVITLNNNTPVLWPPDHSYRTFQVTDFVTGVSDNCGSLSVANVTISSVTSDETEDDPNGGDGNTLNDIVIAPNCRSVQLRAERLGDGNGRVYTITFKVTDSAGNVTTATAKVLVPKSDSNGGAVNDGPHYTVNSSCP